MLLYACIMFQEFYVRRLHCLLTDFIVLMPLKLKDLRNRADETARTVQVYTHVRHISNTKTVDVNNSVMGATLLSFSIGS